MGAVCLRIPVEENSMLFGLCADESTSTAECWLPVDLLETALQREGARGGKVLFTHSQAQSHAKDLF